MVIAVSNRCHSSRVRRQPLTPRLVRLRRVARDEFATISVGRCGTKPDNTRQICRVESRLIRGYVSSMAHILPLRATFNPLVLGSSPRGRTSS